MNDIRYYINLVEATGDPENPSRRGFLKGMAGAAATAAMPGGIAKLATTASTVAPAAAAAVSASPISALWAAAVNIAANQGQEFDSTHYSSSDPEWEKIEKYGEIWEPGVNDLVKKPIGLLGRMEFGHMPWGSMYQIDKTPMGVGVMFNTIEDYGNRCIFFKDGKTLWFDIIHDRDRSWIRDSNIPNIDELFSDYEDALDDDNITFDEEYDFEVAFIDLIVSGKLPNSLPDSTDSSQSVDQNTSISNASSANLAQKAGTTAADLARLAGLVKKGIDTLSPDTTGASELPQAKPTQALPAPAAPEILEPDLNKEKSKVPINKKST